MTPYKKQTWKLRGQMAWHLVSAILFISVGYYVLIGDYPHANFCLILNLFPMPTFLKR
jgi:hypothetical protein